MKKILSLGLACVMLAGLTACGSSSSVAASSSAAQETTLTGQGQGFGGVITATITMNGDTITAVAFDGPNETEAIGGAALEELAAQVVAANGAEIDGVSGATFTSEGCKAAVLNALDPDAAPAAEAEAEPVQWPTGMEEVEIPSDRKIVSASTYGMYTRDETSAQDAVIKATLYWDMTNDACYAIRFLEPLTPWMDTGSTSGWACVEDAAVLEKLGDAVIPFASEATEYSPAVETNYAKYIQIGDLVWTGAQGSTANSSNAIVYTAEINGETVTLFDYCSTEEGGKWYVDVTAEQPCYLLTNDQPAASGDDANVAFAYEMEYKESTGHGVGFWSSPITFPGNIELLKQFAQETNFSYDYYADGGLTKNEDGYWQTPDAVSGATIDEGCTYLDMMKTLYDRIQAGDYTEEN